MSETPKISGLAQVAMSVADLDRAVAFYRDVIGLQFLFTAPLALAFFQCGPTRLMLSSQPGETVSSHPILFYAVDDIHAAFAAIKAKGAPVKEEPRVIAKLGNRDVWLASAEDPDGHMVGIMCEVPVTG